MFLIVLGIIVLLAGFVLSRQENQNARFGSLVSLVGGVLLVLGAFTSMFKKIDTGEVGVKTLFGKVSDDVLYSGLNVVNPLMEVTTYLSEDLRRLRRTNFEQYREVNSHFQSIC